MSTTTELKLLPCPFCGGAKLYISTNSIQPDDFHDAWVECNDCEAKGRHAMTVGGWLSSKDEAKEEAIAAWNRRSAARGESKVPQFIVRDAERAIDAATNPKGMHTNGPAMARIEASRLAALLRYAQMGQAEIAEQVSEREGYFEKLNQRQYQIIVQQEARITELESALQHTAPTPSNAGEWTDTQADILRRAAEILEHDCGRPHNAKELRALLSSAPAQAGSAESEREAVAALDALADRLDLIHRLCCGTAPKQSVGELVAVMQKMPEWSAIRAALSAQDGQQSDNARDAARYRALRRGQKWSVIDGIGDTLRADDLDAAIDAAMSTTPSEKEQG